LIVEFLEFFCKLAEQLVSPLEIVRIDNPLLQHLNARVIFTVVYPVFFHQNVSEESRPKSKKINLKLPSFVSRIDLLSRISRCVTKGRGDVWSCQCYSLTMSLPDLVN
jgi:hypothetical protein